MAESARLLVSTEIIERVLFEDSSLRARITGCGWDDVAGCIELFLEGADVPAGGDVRAEVTERSREVRLIPIRAPSRAISEAVDGALERCGIL